MHVKNPFDETPLLICCRLGLVEVVRLLLDLGDDVNYFGPEGRTPIYYACLCEHVEVSLLLLQRGAIMPNAYVSKNYTLIIISLRQCIYT